jgi:hypothetical protein
MGTLHIGQEAVVDLDDDLLEHIFAVLVAKLRRNEPVLLRWENADGRLEQVLVQAAALLRATFDSARTERLDHAWLECLMVAANSNGGICLATADLTRHTRAIPTPHHAAGDHRLRVPLEHR